LGAALLSLVLPIARGGLWDPQELELTDWARRAAIHLFGAEALAVPGSNNSIPTIEEVGRGELPVNAAAFSLALFGLSEWAVRLPMVAFATLGVLAVGLCCWRLSGLRAGTLSVLILATTPLYFVHARTALGDGVTMACMAAAFSGLALACFDDRLSRPLRTLSALGGLLFAIGGLFCRGALVGVALPALSVGMTALLLHFTRKGSGRTPADTFGRWCGLAVFMTGLVFAGLGLVALFRASADDYWVLLGSSLNTAKKLPTHDSVIHMLGHGMFPWSALAPLIIGLVLKPPPGSAGALLRDGALRMSLLSVVALSVGIYGFLAPTVGALPFGAVFGLAGLLAIALVELDSRAEGVPLAAMGTVALLVILYKDFDASPEKVMSAFSIGASELPDGFSATTRGALKLVAGVCLPVFVVLTVERLGFVKWPLNWVKARWLGSAWASKVPLSGPRSLFVATAMLTAGLVLSLGYYPALASQLSPVGAFDTYRELSEPGQPLATLGTDSRHAIYFGGATAENFETEAQALQWLRADAVARRWLVLSQDKLATFNSRYRKEGQKPPQNVPVLMAGSGDMALVSNRVQAGEEDRNPYREWLLSARPAPQHELRVKFESQLQVLGWEIRDTRGAATDVLARGQTYEFRMYYEVLAPVTRHWKVFLHIDGHDKRLNGDHDILSGAYPFRLWNPGDFVVDSYEFSFDDSYPTGDYQAYFGLFSGKTRFAVSEGEHSDNRVLAGTLSLARSAQVTNP
jgi:4-amino-4-deoxy-L-arabinose transferase-like glycosyltransferase